MQTSQSRLKCRKVLGMGESVDGQFHRSKITQLLGRDSMTSWHISSDEYPTGLLLMQRIVCFFFLITGLISIFYPVQIQSYFLSVSYMEELDVAMNSYSDSEHGVLLRHMDIVTKLLGVLLFTLGTFYAIMLLWNAHSRRTLRISLLINVVFSVLTAVFLFTSDSSSPSSEWSWKLNILPYSMFAIITVLSIGYYNRASRDQNYNKLKRINTMDYSD